MKKTLIVLALAIMSTALFSQSLTFVSNEIHYDLLGNSGSVEKNTVIKVYEDRSSIIQEDEESLTLWYVTEVEKVYIDEYGGITTSTVLCRDQYGAPWLLGISDIADLNQFTITIYQETEEGTISVMFFGYFKENPKLNKNEVRSITI